MTLLIITVVLYALVGYLFVLAHRRGDGSVHRALAAAVANAKLVLPRVVIAVLGAGFIAAVLPKGAVMDAVGPGSGVGGLALATLVGTVTPGGPMVVFAIGISLLKAGAGTAAVVTYLTAWCLFNLNRTLLWEAPRFGWRYVLGRWGV
ncbi:MAG: hypothetical protein ACFCBW_11725, partial [Candidatus Competibacterales bacterium]